MGEKTSNISRNLLVSLVITVTLITAWAAAGWAATPAEIEKRKTPVVRVVERVASSVVNISTQQVVQRRVSPFGGLEDNLFGSFFKDFLAPEFIQRFKLKTLGSGIVFDDGQKILTNAHVIEGAQTISVLTNRGKRLQASLIGSDALTDIAVLRLKKSASLPPIPLGTSSDLMIGETVIAIGNPFGLSNTVTVGVVSSLHRSLNGENRIYKNLIQTDASINPGNSGGPLLNILGRVIGINTAIYSKAQGIGFAIPIDEVKKIAKTLLIYGQVPPVWIGIDCQVLTPSIARHFKAKGIRGILITDLEPGSPAARSHLTVGDILVAINHEPVSSPVSLQQVLSQFLPGDTVSLSVYRDGRNRALPLTLQRLTPHHGRLVTRRLFGFELRPLNRRERARLAEAGIEGGIAIAGVVPHSIATINGLREGDVLLRLNGVRLNDLATFYQQCIAHLRGGHFEFLLLRGTYTYRLIFNLYQQTS